jgi:hypothetical protein
MPTTAHNKKQIKDDSDCSPTSPDHLGAGFAHPSFKSNNRSMLICFADQLADEQK